MSKCTMWEDDDNFDPENQCGYAYNVGSEFVFQEGIEESFRQALENLKNDGRYSLDGTENQLVCFLAGGSLNNKGRSYSFGIFKATKEEELHNRFFYASTNKMMKMNKIFLSTRRNIGELDFIFIDKEDGNPPVQYPNHNEMTYYDETVRKWEVLIYSTMKIRENPSFNGCCNDVVLNKLLPIIKEVFPNINDSYIPCKKPDPPKPPIPPAGHTPDGKVFLLNCPELSSDYSNTWMFENHLEQLKYFQTREVKTFERYSYLRKEQALKVECHVDDIYNANYLMYQNRGGKWYYCFILDKEYINEKTTKIYITTDLIQTYLFDVELTSSYVDRCHVDRWTPAGKPTNEIENEGLEFGEYIQTESNNVYQFKDAYIAVCSNPLGKIPFRKDISGGQGQGGDECGNWEEGILSDNGFRFIKGFEAFAPIHYLDTLAKPNPVNTIAYGVTEHGEKNIYDMLVKKEPVKEEEGAKISYNLKNENYGKKIVNVCKAIGVTKQHQFDALVSLAYNAGVGAVTEQGSLMQLIKKDPNNCTAIKAKWENYYNASQIEGVRLRRIEEAKMFCGEKYEVRPISIVDNRGKPTGKVVTENNGNGWLPTCGGDPSGETYRAEGYNWKYPTTGTVTSIYGDRIHPITGQLKKHHGIDIAKSQGTPIIAPRDGTVETAGWGGSAGNWIIIHHDDINMKTVYMHCYELFCKTGQKVKAGDKIASQGTTGSSTGVHLHFELRLPPFNRTDTVNPIPSAKKGDIIK